MAISFDSLRLLWGEPNSYETPSFSTLIGPITTDSRNISPGDFFIPLIGQNYDGHEFIGEAFQKGVQATVISRKVDVSVPDKLLHWVVDDTLNAYQELAQLHRSLLQKPVIAVTGSVGKTTTRELIKASLEHLGPIVSSLGNENNNIGVPKTLLQLSSDDAAVVVEMGMRGPQQIERLSKCTKPDIAVITNIGSAHIGLLGKSR